MAAKPNRGHEILAELEKDFDIEIITQNIDDLHERAGSAKVTHLHGIITKSQSDKKANLIYPIKGTEIKMGDLCELGSQLRPHVVWFGESVPMIEVAAKICRTADIFVLIGTSLAVYPAAGLIDFIPSIAPKYIIDPKTPDVKRYRNVISIEKNAVAGVAELQEILLNEQ